MLFTNFYRSPDAGAAGSASGNAADKKASRAKRFLPETQVELVSLASTVAPAYAAGAAATPSVVLNWQAPASFTTMTTALATHLADANVAKAERTPNADAIEKLDAEVNLRLGNVRRYLGNKYEDEADNTVRGYLPALGFKEQHGSYVFPKGQKDRLDALNTLLSGLTKHGIGANKYDLAYWTDLRDRYKQALADAGNDSGAVSTVVDSKNELLDQVTEVLRAIYYLLRAQFPKSWKARLRAYGYREEGYS